MKPVCFDKLTYNVIIITFFHSLHDYDRLSLATFDIPFLSFPSSLLYLYLT